MQFVIPYSTVYVILAFPEKCLSDLNEALRVKRQPLVL